MFHLTQENLMDFKQNIRRGGHADHRYLRGVDAAGCRAVQPLSETVCGGCAGECGAPGVLPRFLGQTLCAAPSAQTPAPAPSASWRRAASPAASYGRCAPASAPQRAPA